MATDNPRVLTNAFLIQGKDEIEKELLYGTGKKLQSI